MQLRQVLYVLYNVKGYPSGRALAVLGVRAWPEGGRRVAGVWSERGRSVVGGWPCFGRAVAVLWPRCSCALAAL
jgi:hypothetical protein